MILFLDFDGVLHPQYEGEPTPVGEVFCHLPRFEPIMRDFPFVEIVISSTWREQFSLEVPRSKFSPDIAARIICVTPMIDLTDGVFRQSARENEILAWLRLNQRLDAARRGDNCRMSMTNKRMSQTFFNQAGLDSQ